jgi:hypothetical protein
MNNDIAFSRFRGAANFGVIELLPMLTCIRNNDPCDAWVAMLTAASACEWRVWARMRCHHRKRTHSDLARSVSQPAMPDQSLHHGSMAGDLTGNVPSSRSELTRLSTGTHYISSTLSTSARAVSGAEGKARSPREAFFESSGLFGIWAASSGQTNKVNVFFPLSGIG